MRITLLRSLTLKVKGLSICLLVTLVVAASAIGQTQITTDPAPGTIVAESESLPAGHVADKQPVAQQPKDELKRWGISLHAGVSIPHGDFGNVFNPGGNVAFDLEYRVNRTFSVEGIYGYHRFRGDSFGPFRLDDLNLHQFSVNGKVYSGSSPTRAFFNFGGGAYVFTPGVSTHGGLNIGGGVQHDISPGFAVEGVYNFHNVFTSGSNTQFSTVQGGVRFRF